MLGGCSLVYNESNIPTPAPDAFEPEAEVITFAGAAWGCSSHSLQRV